MSDPYNHEFRITAWPANRLPNPWLARRQYELRDNALVISPEPATAADYFTDSAGEVYLKLRAVDLDDPQAILAFANEYGVLGIRANGFEALNIGAEGSPVAQRREDARKALAQARKANGGADDLLAWGDERPRSETVNEFRLAAEWLADLTNLWLVVADAPAEMLRRRSLPRLPEGVESPAWLIAPADWAESRFVAGLWLEKALSPALRPFHPRLMLRYPKDAEGRPTIAGRAAAVDFLSASLFAVCALELFNHVAEDAAYKICANARCGRLFVRQEGRARHGQHRIEGVRFCSESCLRAQKQRDYRARQSAQQRRT